MTRAAATVPERALFTPSLEASETLPSSALSSVTAGELAQDTPNQFWYPGVNLDSEYPTPTDMELRDSFATYRADAAEIRSTNGVYGVYSAIPAGRIRAIASIDIDEVIRDAMGALHAVTGIADTVKSYATGTWFDETTRGRAYKQNVITSILRITTNAGVVPPMPQIEVIRSVVHSWRQQGIYCVANTSTLPGCEPGTIKYTLGRDMPDCFDAVLFPRNHHGKEPLTKAVAIGMLANDLGVNLQALPIVHIDDTDHHIRGFEAAYPDHAAENRLGLFAPVAAISTLPAEMCCPSSLQAFERADAFFKEQLPEITQ